MQAAFPHTAHRVPVLWARFQRSSLFPRRGERPVPQLGWPATRSSVKHSMSPWVRRSFRHSHRLSRLRPKVCGSPNSSPAQRPKSPAASTNSPGRCWQKSKPTPPIPHPRHRARPTAAKAAERGVAPGGHDAGNTGRRGETRIQAVDRDINSTRYQRQIELARGLKNAPSDGLSI